MKPSIILTLALFAGVSFAQSGTRQLTLDEAIRIALEKNFDSRTSELAVERSTIERSAAGDALLPSVTGSAGYSIGQSLTKNSFTDQIPDATHSANYSVRAGLNIYNGGGDAARIRSADYALESAKHTLKWERQTVAYNVISAYINALRTRELLNAADKTLAQSRAELTRVQGLFDAGATAIGTVYQQEAQVGQQELQSIQAKNDYDNAKADLLYLLNLPSDTYTQYDVNTTGIDTSIVSLKSKTVAARPTESEIQSVIDQRDDIAAARTAILSRQASVDVTKSGLLPSLDASASIGGSGLSTSMSNIPFFNSLGAGLSLSVPIFERNQIRAQIETQEIDIMTSRIRLEQQEQLFRADVAKAYNTLRSSELALESADRALRAAEENLRSAEERFRAGAGIQTDVIVAQSTIQNARTNSVNAIYTFIFAQRNLDYLLGRWNY